MGHGKGGYGFQEHHPALNNQKQAKDKEQVVNTHEDMMEAEPQVLAGCYMPGSIAAQFRQGLGWPGHCTHHGPVKPGKPYKDIGDGGLKAGETDNFALYTFPSGCNDPIENYGISPASLSGLAYGFPVCRQLQLGRVRFAVINGRPPGNIITVRAQLLDLQ